MRTRRLAHDTGHTNQLEIEMNEQQRAEWIGIYKQYRAAGHGPVYAAQIASGIVIDGQPF